MKKWYDNKRWRLIKILVQMFYKIKLIFAF